MILASFSKFPRSSEMDGPFKAISDSFQTVDVRPVLLYGFSSFSCMLGRLRVMCCEDTYFRNPASSPEWEDIDVCRLMNIDEGEIG